MNRYGTAYALLHELRLRGVKCWPEGAQLMVYPRSRLTAGLAARIREYKPELLVLAALPQGDAETAAVLAAEADEAARARRPPGATCGYVPLGRREGR